VTTTARTDFALIKITTLIPVDDEFRLLKHVLFNRETMPIIVRFVVCRLPSADAIVRQRCVFPNDRSTCYLPETPDRRTDVARCAAVSTLHSPDFYTVVCHTSIRRASQARIDFLARLNTYGRRLARRKWLYDGINHRRCRTNQYEAVERGRL
jgi:hypothetical protein